MQLKETQTQKRDISSPENTPAYINPKNPSKSEDITQVQKDSVITSQDLPDKRLHYGFTLVL
ncbi:hypothetical protein JYQ62_11170 [Nostoc sp. UHCC 0702]|nr:hypothetical protein JYQ62_11170 [Nostoc sp. UHCC 0702]